MAHDVAQSASQSSHGPIHVSVARRVHPAKSVPDLCQPHDVARRVRLGQNHGPIHVSVARRVHPAKSVPDLCQPHDVARSVVRSMSVA